MSNKTLNFIITRRLSITAASVLLGLGAFTSAVQASPVVAQSGVGVPLILAAATEGADRRQDRRGDRQDERGDRRDTRQDCRGDEGVGKDKRDCKQEGRQERGKDDKG